MSFHLSRSSRWAVALLLASAGTAFAQTIDCNVSRCAFRDAQGKCRPEAADVLNNNCSEWNAGVAVGQWPGLLPSGERVPKPMGAVQLRERARQFNACVTKNTRPGVTKPQAIELCMDLYMP